MIPCIQSSKGLQVRTMTIPVNCWLKGILLAVLCSMTWWPFCWHVTFMRIHQTAPAFFYNHLMLYSKMYLYKINEGMAVAKNWLRERNAPHLKILSSGLGGVQQCFGSLVQEILIFCQEDGSEMRLEARIWKLYSCASKK